MVSEPVSENLVPKKFSESVPEKFGTGRKSRNQYQKNLVPKKVSESVSKKFGTEKSLRIGLGNIWYRKKSQNRYWKFFVLELIFGAKI